MLGWLENVSSRLFDGLGSAVGSFLKWLFGGIVDVLTIVIEAFRGVWDFFDSVWNLVISFCGILDLFVSVLFPFVPEPVVQALSGAVFVSLVIGLVHLFRKVSG